MTFRTPSLVLLSGLVAITWWLLRQPLFASHADRRRISNLDLVLGDQLPSLLNFSADAASMSGYYASGQARAFCDAHGYSVFAPRSQSGQRKIYDLFMVNTEMDWIEVRLETLYHHVDYFVIVESAKTFQGTDKPLAVFDNWHRLQRFHDKIIYHQLAFPAGFSPKRTWDYEDLQRDAMYDQVFPGLTGRSAPVYGDVLLVADVDEIPRPESLLLLRTCDFPARLTLASRFYYYSFQFLHSGPEWPHPQATFYRGWRTVRPSNLRNGDGGIFPFRDLDKSRLANAAWHCSNCFGTMEQFLNKMASFSHAWMNHEYFRDRDYIADAIREGRDVWGRETDTFDRIDGNQDVPSVLRRERDKYKYMLDRSGKSAGFTDYP
ncbi:glycosyltransferase family 17 protein [Trichoderma ceciliae]